MKSPTTQAAWRELLAGTGISMPDTVNGVPFAELPSGDASTEWPCTEARENLSDAIGTLTLRGR